MFCPKCGDLIEPNEKFCSKCGNPLFSQVIPKQPNRHRSFSFSHLSSTKLVFLGMGIGLFVVVFLFIFLSFLGIFKEEYYFDSTNGKEENEIIQSPTTSVSKKGKYSTIIVYDHTYSNVKVTKEQDALALIQEDSISQKKNCPSQMKKIEDEMIRNYGITAVNLCEMDIEFAKELGNVFKKITQEYPSVKGHITNLTLVNGSVTDSYIAAFMPVFNFATSDTTTTYPWVIKTQILLNTTYFLNEQRLLSSVNSGSQAGHFPKNATIYSPVAHELGHYLSFLAMMKHYQLKSILLINGSNLNTFYNIYKDFDVGTYSLTMINEAYQKYKKDTNSTISLDAFRGTISQYALAKDNRGQYIYDETIAEAFHDVYLNGKNAAQASQYIVDVLKSKLGR